MKPVPTQRMRGKMLPWHSLERSRVAEILKADPLTGLQDADSSVRLKEYGPNSLPEKRSRPLGHVFLLQFRSPLIYLLLVAALIAIVMGRHGDSAVILCVVVLNALIGTVQEGRAERSMKALRRISLTRVQVVRSGTVREIDNRDLVPGDILLLAAGDQVGGDARLLEASSLRTDESALTGESLPVAKEAGSLPEETALADRTNMVYSGTHVSAGRGRAVVVATGVTTEIGRIAELTASAHDPKTPLEARIAAFGRHLAAASVLLFAVLITVGLLRGMPFAEILVLAICQMVSVVPEGLPAAMTIALAIGMQRMALRGVIVRRLAAIETLGSTAVICSDKTGTLTKNEMTVTSVWLPGGHAVSVRGAGYDPEGSVAVDGVETDPAGIPGLRSLLEAGSLCNDATLLQPDSAHPRWRALGDPTEAALLTLARKCGVDPDSLNAEWPRSAEIPFDPSAKMMATQHSDGHSGKRIVIKGAPEVVIGLCNEAGSGTGRSQLSPARRATALGEADRMAKSALRCLAVGEASHPGIEESEGPLQFTGRVTLLGLVGQMDPPRDEAGKALQTCREAGIRTVMLTGDHKDTGLAVARMLGIAHAGDIALDGRELEKLTEEELLAGLDRVRVFARVYPSHKQRIINAFQSQGRVVAMTGDGVNDAPALASADVGVAMGISGTEVAKGAAKIVITDDNFATIVEAIREGRIVYRNIKKVILYLFATSLDEVLILLLALFFGYPLPLAAVQILWINVVTESVATVNLVMEGAEGDEMQHPPPPLSEAIVDPVMWRRLAVMVTSSVLVVFGFFIWRLSTNAPFVLVQSETFTLLAVSQWFNMLNCRSEYHSALLHGLLRNYWLIAGLLLGAFLQFLVIYTAPMNRFFHTVPIPAGDLLLIFALASLVLVSEEVRKYISRGKARGPSGPKLVQ